METIFINSENSKTSKAHVWILKLTNKLDLRKGEKVIALSNLSIYYTWDDEFELPDGLYSVSDIQDYFEYFLEKHGESVDNASVQIYVNNIENRIAFKVKNGYSLALLTPETKKLLGSTKNKITEDKIGKNLPHLEIAEVVLVHCVSILLIMIISKIQEFCIRLFQINHSVAY